MINSLLNKNISIYDIQVIVSQKHNNGTVELNKTIAEAFNKPVNKTNKFKILDPVIQNVNNYKKGIFNGQKGRITSLMSMKNGDIKELNVTFDNKVVVYQNDEIQEIERAYALTVHKMQGSEERVVIFVVSSKHKNLNRSLIYTAVTRAVDRVIIVGDKDTFNIAVTTECRARNSNLIKRLQEMQYTSV